ncbi:hypothetical protein Tco_0889270 [Tanacetum coccineum]
MANLSEDIQCAGSDTRPPMLDRTDFDSWQQRICLYCRGKENGVNILKSIDEGPFQMGTFWETLAEGTEGSLHLGLERPRVYCDLSPKDKERQCEDAPGRFGINQRRPRIITIAQHWKCINLECYLDKIDDWIWSGNSTFDVLGFILFWSTAKIKTVNNERQIRAKVNGKTIVISESSVRRDLQFNDEDGIACLTNTEIFENLQLMGYENLSDRLTFYKSYFSPQWKYLIHTILQCLSSKSTAWNEFGTNIASAVICLAKNQKFNFSKLIFDGMLRNLDPNSKKFLMYPRFLQLFLNNQIENLEAVFNDEYDTPSHTKKVFANMRRQGKDFLGTVTPLFPSMLASQVVEGEGSGQPSEPQHTPITASLSHVVPIPTVASLSHPKKTHKHRKTKRKATKISQSGGPTTLVADETVHKERGDSVERAAITGARLDVEQDSGNIIRTQYMATLNERIPRGTSLSSGPRCQDTILGGRPAQTRFKRQDCLKGFLPIKTAQNLEITNLKKRVMKLEKKKKERTSQLKRGLFKVRIESSAEKSLGDQEDASKQGRNEIDQDEEISWFQEDVETQGSAPVTTASVSVSTAEPSTPLTTTILIKDEDLTIAQTLMKMRNVKSKEKSKEKGVSSETTIRPTRAIIMKEASENEPDKPVKVKGIDQIAFDEEVAQRLEAQMQAEYEEEERVARQRKEEDNLISWDNTQAMMEADYELARRLQAEEQEELTIKERSKLFVEIMDKRKKHFAKLRVEEIRRKPPTKAHKRNQLCTYLKNMAKYKHSQLKNKSFEEIQMLFDNAMKWVDSFIPMDSEVVEGSKSQAEGSKKRTRKELDEESVKRQNLEDDAKKAKLKACLEKTRCIIRSSEFYKIFSVMLDDFDRQDVLDLYRLVKERFETTSPEGYDRLLWGDLITLFEPIHLLLMDTGITIHMMVEKKCSLTQEMLSRMLSGKLEVDHECEMAYELLRFTKSQYKM